MQFDYFVSVDIGDVEAVGWSWMKCEAKKKVTEVVVCLERSWVKCRCWLLCGNGVGCCYYFAKRMGDF